MIFFLKIINFKTCLKTLSLLTHERIPYTVMDFRTVFVIIFQRDPGFRPNMLPPKNSMHIKIVDPVKGIVKRDE